MSRRKQLHPKPVKQAEGEANSLGDKQQILESPKSSTSPTCLNQESVGNQNRVNNELLYQYISKEASEQSDNGAADAPSEQSYKSYEKEMECVEKTSTQDAVFIDAAREYNDSLDVDDSKSPVPEETIWLINRFDTSRKRTSCMDVNGQKFPLVENKKIKLEPVDDTVERTSVDTAEHQLPNDLASECSSSTDVLPDLQISPRQALLKYVCNACSIKFSNRSTLEAHQAHYCSKNYLMEQFSPKLSQFATVPLNGILNIATPFSVPKPECEKSNTNVGIDSEFSTKPRDASDSWPSSTHRIVNYKKSTVSWPAISSVGSIKTSDPAAYCSQCDIQFQSTETLKVHKKHYCSLRQKAKKFSITNQSVRKDDLNIDDLTVRPSSNAHLFSSFSPRASQVSEPESKVIFVPYIVPSAAVHSGVDPPDIHERTAVGVKGNSTLVHADCRSDLKVEKQELPLDLSIKKSTAEEKELPEKNHKANFKDETDSSLISERINTSTASESLCHVAKVQGYMKKGVSRCSECNIVFFSHDNYLVHKQYYCASRDEKVSCSKTAVVSATASVPCEDTEKVSDCSIKSPDGENEKKNWAGSCATCRINFSSLESLQAHQVYYGSEVHETMTHQDSIHVSESQFKASRDMRAFAKNIATQRSWNCTICGQEILSESNLIEHLRLHNLASMYECTVCRYRGATIRGMRTHIKLHQNIKESDFSKHVIQILVPTVCSDFNHLEELPGDADSDTEALLAKRRPYKRRMSRKSGTARHLHVCELCGSIFENYSDLTFHMQLHAAELKAKNQYLSESQELHTNYGTKEMRTVSTDEASALLIKQESESDNEQHEQTSIDIQQNAVAENTENVSEPIVDVKQEGNISDDDAEVQESSRPLSVNNNSLIVNASTSDDYNVVTSGQNIPQSFNVDINKHCSHCNITFTYLKSFLVHKHYYCQMPVGPSKHPALQNIDCKTSKHPDLVHE